MKLSKGQNDHRTLVGYARVSSVGQSLDVQLDKLGHCHKVFREKKSGASDNRPRLKACLEYVREGDTLVVETSRINYPFFDLPPWWGIPQTEAMELVERFTLQDETLAYDFWAYDPTTFAAPIDKPRFLVWTWEPGLEVGTDNCEVYFEDP